MFIVPTLAAMFVSAAPPTPTLFDRGISVVSEPILPTNERGITALALDEQGRILAGTTGRAAHIIGYDPATHRSLDFARLPGGIGVSYGLAALPDGSVIFGTQADPTAMAVATDPRAVGHLYRLRLDWTKGGGALEDLGELLAGQGVFALAIDDRHQTVLVNTWPDGHFVTFDLATRKATDLGAIAGHRTFETPFHADQINKSGSEQSIHYPRQVSRAIAVVPGRAALTAGAKGELFRYDFGNRELKPTGLFLPAARGREPWCSLDAVTVYPRSHDGEDYPAIVGGTSDGHLFELRLYANEEPQLRPRGKPFAAGGIQGLVRIPATAGGDKGRAVVGLCGRSNDVPRAFQFTHGGSSSAVTPLGVPHVAGQPSFEPAGALLATEQGIYVGECDRIGRLVFYPFDPEPKAAAKPKPSPRKAKPAETAAFEPATSLPCHVTFAPPGTTTEGSGYTALAVGTDGQVYVGSARYGDYAWLMRFDPARKPLFMDKLVSMRQLTGERKVGIHTQGKIHARILVAQEGKVYFASKQAHEVFDTRPEYGEDADGFPGGHICVYDAKTGFARSFGIPMPGEGLMGGILDESRGRLYFRSEPRNHFLVYDLKTGDVMDRGQVGAMGRYMAMDERGRVYTVGRGSVLCRYDPESNEVEDLTIAVQGEGDYKPSYVVAMGPDGVLYGATAGHPSIMAFDIAQASAGPMPTVPMRNVVAAAPPGWPVQDVHAATFGLDGRLYYPLNTTGPLKEGGPAVAHLRIMAFDPKTGRATTVGIPDTSSVDESKVRHAYNRGDKYGLEYMQGAAVGPDGTLYLMDIYPQLNVASFPRLTAAR